MRQFEGLFFKHCYDACLALTRLNRKIEEKAQQFFCGFSLSGPASKKSITARKKSKCWTISSAKATTKGYGRRAKTTRVSSFATILTSLLYRMSNIYCIGKEEVGLLVQNCRKAQHKSRLGAEEKHSRTRTEKEQNQKTTWTLTHWIERKRSFDFNLCIFVFPAVSKTARPRAYFILFFSRQMAPQP